MRFSSFSFNKPDIFEPPSPNYPAIADQNEGIISPLKLEQILGDATFLFASRMTETLVQYLTKIVAI